MKKFIALISALTLLTSGFIFTSCQNTPDGDGDDQGAIEKLKISSDYVLTIPDRATDTEKFLASKLKDSLQKENGVSLTISNDWTSEDFPAAECEILVGNTVRDESKAVYEKLSENEWAVTASGKKIVVAGASNKALTDAVNYFIDTYVKGKTVAEMEADAAKYETSKLVYFSWQKDGETVKLPVSGSYPRMYKLQDGRLMCAYDGIYAVYSNDDGLTWNFGNGKTISTHPKYSCANAAIIQLDDGEILVAYRATGTSVKGYYRGIHVSSSKDNGKTWSHHSDVIITDDAGDKGVWEPHFFMVDGVLTVAYANDDENYITSPYQYLEYKQYIDGEWVNRTIMADGVAHKSRDGMPTVIQLSSGEYVCALEGWKLGTYQLMIKLIYSEDGKTWSEPIDIYEANEVNAGAPSVAELPTGQLVISFQTSEDNKDGLTTMKTLISDGTPIQALSAENFTEPDYPFEVPAGKQAAWGGLYTTEDYIYICAGVSGKLTICRYKISDK